MDILFIVAARGGSKGVPKKNITVLGDLPLIAYKIISAQKCKFSKRIIVSTDDSEIANIALKYGADVPFVRPKELATDTASSMDVVLHAMNWVQDNDGEKYKLVCLLEPSSPFLTYEDINDSIDKMLETDSDTMVSVVESDVSTRFIHPIDNNGKLSLFYETIKNGKSVRRQDQVTEYRLNGCIYVAKWEYFISNRLFHSINSIPYYMDKDKSVEIDSVFDLDFARYLVNQGIIDLSPWELG